MRNLSYETLSEHSYEVAIISQIIAIIGNQKFGKAYDVNRVAASALYHDMSEILTGDLPTPVKYYNAEIKKAYKNIEKNAEEILLNLLPEAERRVYAELLLLSDEEKKVVKSADKICAYIKCLAELSGGNNEFVAAERTIKEQIADFSLPEAKYFVDNYLDAFTKPLDDITL